MASSRDRTPSEFGGVPGRTLPAPAALSNVDRLRMERATNPDDPSDTPEKALRRELDMEGRA